MVHPGATLVTLPCTPFQDTGAPFAAEAVMRAVLIVWSSLSLASGVKRHLRRVRAKPDRAALQLLPRCRKVEIPGARELAHPARLRSVVAVGHTNTVKGSHMSKKAAARAPKAPVTRDVVARTMGAVAKKHGGQVPPRNYVGRLQRSEAARTGGKDGSQQ